MLILFAMLCHCCFFDAITPAIFSLAAAIRRHTPFFDVRFSLMLASAAFADISLRLTADITAVSFSADTLFAIADVAVWFFFFAFIFFSICYAADIIAAAISPIFYAIAHARRRHFSLFFFRHGATLYFSYYYFAIVSFSSLPPHFFAFHAIDFLLRYYFRRFRYFSIFCFAAASRAARERVALRAARRRRSRQSAKRALFFILICC
jgi:hypothetical protein